MTYRLIALCLASGIVGCLNTGCTDSVKHAFGYTEPAVDISYGIFGAHARVSSEFTGEADLKRDAETGAIQELHVKVQSGVADVYDAQGRRITDNFLKGRSQEYEFKIQATQAIFDGVGNLIDKATGLIVAGKKLGGPEGQSMVDSGLGLLKSSPELLSMAGQASGIGSEGVAALLQAVSHGSKVNDLPVESVTIPKEQLDQLYIWMGQEIHDAVAEANKAKAGP